MTVLVVGASGATGLWLVKDLLNRGATVKAIVRSPERLPIELLQHENLCVIQASLLELSDAEMAQHVKGCRAVASCLGHNLNFKGMFGHPRRLVTEAVRRLCMAIKANAPEGTVKFVLMNTTGNSNRDLDEEIEFSQKLVIALLRILLPPHVDNENAADYLRTEIGQSDEKIEWSAVRPDALVDADIVSDYEIVASPTRNAIFDAGKISRINVANFMANLIMQDEEWQQWKGKMPVIYGQA
ncbi:MAG: NAD(P)-binding oxidoreductase [Gallionella sp.]